MRTFFVLLCSAAMILMLVSAATIPHNPNNDLKITLPDTRATNGIANSEVFTAPIQATSIAVASEGEDENKPQQRTLGLLALLPLLFGQG